MSRPRLFFLTAGAALAVLVALSLALGSQALALRDVWGALTGGAVSDEIVRVIVLALRLPRPIAAILAGAALGVSGLQMQTLFRNPLAGPYVLGLSSGASLGVAFVMLAAGAFGLALPLAGMGAWTIALAALAGAAGVLALVSLAATRVDDSATLLIIGLMFAAFTSAVVALLQFYAEAERVQAFLFWTFGSLAGVHWEQMPVFALLIGAGLVGAILLVKPLNAFLLGARYAESMGVPVRRTRLLVFLSTSALAGGVTAFCGPISFIGLAVPHLARVCVQTSDHRTLLPATALMGAVVLVACDLIARVPGSTLTLPLNAVTALVGAPVVVWVLLKGRSLQFQG